MKENQKKTIFSSLIDSLKNNWFKLLLVLFIIAGSVFCFLEYGQLSGEIVQYKKEKKALTDNNARLMTEADEKDKKIAEYLAKIDAGKKTPVNNYYVTAATATDAAEQIKNDLRKGNSSVKPIMDINGDYTLVQPYDDKQLVNVYRVNKDNPRMFGLNVSNNSKSIVAGYDRILLNYGRQNRTHKKTYGVTYLIRW